MSYLISKTYFNCEKQFLKDTLGKLFQKYFDTIFNYRKTIINNTIGLKTYEYVHLLIHVSVGYLTSDGNVRHNYLIQSSSFLQV